MSFLAHILCVFEQIITFALHFRDVGCIIKLAGPTGGCLIACSHSFHFTLALQQLDNQSLWKHPVYPPGPMLNACVQRWLLGDSHVYRWRTFRLAGWWDRVSSYTRFSRYPRHSRYSRLSSCSRLSRHPSYLATLGLLVHRWGAAIFSPFHLFTFKRGAAIFSPFHPFTFKRCAAIFSPFHPFTFKGAAIFSPFHLFTFKIPFTFKILFTFKRFFLIQKCFMNDYCKHLNDYCKPLTRVRSKFATAEDGEKAHPNWHKSIYETASADAKTRRTTPISSNLTYL